MKSFRPLSGLTVIVATSLFATGCDRASSTGLPTTVADTGPMTGVLAGLAPEGIEYATETLSGVTTAGGRFQYESGETVSFSLGGTDLGSTAAGPEITVFSLAGLDSTPIGEDAVLAATRTADNTGGFAQAVRVAQLLLSFDTDGDVSNGVQISDATRARLATTDFHATGIQDEFRWKDLVGAVRASVIAGEMPERLIPTEGEALDHVYMSLGISWGLFLAAESSYDNDADGIAEETERFVLNSDGLPLEYRGDYDADGTDDYVQEFDYLSATRYLRLATDNNGDGVFDRVEVNTFDGFGALVMSETDSDGQSGVDRIETRAYDDFGNLIRVEFRNLSTGTSNIQTWTVDAAGNRFEYLFDSDGDGTPNRRDTFVYNDFRDWVRREIDSNNDGTVDQVLTREFNARGILTLATSDLDADGTVDRSTAYVIGADNRIAEFIYDTDDDPDTEFTVALTYNSDGQEIRRVTDRTFENRGISISENEYNAAGKLLRRTIDSDGDGTPNSITVRSYDTTGALLSEDRDFQADGLIDRRTLYAVDNNGNIIEERIDIDGDGTPDAINRYSSMTEINPGYWY